MRFRTENCRQSDTDGAVEDYQSVAIPETVKRDFTGVSAEGDSSRLGRDYDQWPYS